jgi:hypothetical protein
VGLSKREPCSISQVERVKRSSEKNSGFHFKSWSRMEQGRWSGVRSALCKLYATLVAKRGCASSRCALQRKGKVHAVSNSRHKGLTGERNRLANEGIRDHSPPFSLASTRISWFRFTLSKNSCLHFECRTCSTRRLTRFSMYRFPTTLFTMTPTAFGVTL